MNIYIYNIYIIYIFFMYVCIYIYTYTHTYTHIYTHIFHIYIRAYSSCFMHVVVTCMRLPFFSIYFQISYIFAKFSNTLPFSALFLKNCTHAPTFQNRACIYIYTERVFLHSDSLHARMNRHYKACSYKINKHKKIKVYRKSVQKEPYS